MRVADSKILEQGGSLLAIISLLGCQGDPKPDAPASAQSEARPASSVAVPAGSIAPDAARATTDGRTPPGDERATTDGRTPPAASHPFTHGVWSSCADGFRTSNQPQRDVTRLSFLCGPYQGMRKLGRTWFGHVEKDKDSSFDVHLRKGQCARVFAVARSELPSFRVNVTSPSDALVGTGQASAGFALVDHDGAFCVDETGAFRVRVIARQGTGLVAAEVWTLPEK
jgi:hypothetical protein